MVRGYISIGSNIDREQHIKAGLQALAAHWGHLIISSIYESIAIGFAGNPFYNLVVGFDTMDDVYAVSQQLRQIEIANGRPKDSQKFSSRTLDLDLILFGELIVHEGSLQLPRADITQYAFVLQPLAEIAPLLIHPVLKISYHQLWQQFPKEQSIQQCPTHVREQCLATSM